MRHTKEVEKNSTSSSLV